MITIMPIEPEVLETLAEELSLTAEGPVWGYIASDGKSMLGYVIVEKDEPVRVLALRADDPAIADGLLRQGLYDFYAEDRLTGYTFACEVKMPLPMVYTRKGVGSLAAIFEQKCGGR